MRFVEVVKYKRDNKVHKLIDSFLTTKYLQVEVINEDDYESDTAMTAAIRYAIKNHYDGKVQVSRKGSRVVLSKVKAAD